MHHYHVDCTDWYDSLTYNLLDNNKEWVLNELDKWNYTGQYNSRSVGGWFCKSHHKTIEYRCGDMTFEYPIIVKRIINANDITRRLKTLSSVSPEEYELIKARRELEELQKEKKKDKLDIQVSKQIVKSRTIRL